VEQGGPLQELHPTLLPQCLHHPRQHQELRGARFISFLIPPLFGFLENPGTEKDNFIL